jgi:hypothetical protein
MRSGRAGWLAAARYRVWQMWRALTPRPLDEDDRGILSETLPPGGRAIFAAMSRHDQRHSLSVYHALRARGHTDPELLAAALLHDSGKGGGRVRLWMRPTVVLLRAWAPGLLTWLARPPAAGSAGTDTDTSVPRWRRPFYHAWHHAEIGAGLAARAGLSARVVLLIRTHHDSRGPAAELHAVDDAL